MPFIIVRSVKGSLLFIPVSTSSETQTHGLLDPNLVLLSIGQREFVLMCVCVWCSEVGEGGEEGGRREEDFWAGHAQY